LTAQNISYSVFQKVRHPFISSRNEEKCEAIVQIKSQGIRILILSKFHFEILALDDIQFTKELDFSSQISQFQHYIAESSLSELKIDKIWFCYSPQYFCLLPEALFDEKKAELALLQICEIPFFYSIKFSDVKNGAKIVYALPKVWEEWTVQLFGSSEVAWICNHAGFLEDGLQISSGSEKPIHIGQIENDQIFCGVFLDDKLLFFNRFSYKSENDLLYFCLLVMEENQMVPETDRFIITGSLLPGSMGMEKLSRYLGAMEFARPIHSIPFEKEFEVLKHHNYFDLMSQAAYIQGL